MPVSGTVVSAARPIVKMTHTAAGPGHPDASGLRSK